jgi:hypothetical protein
MLGNGIRLTEPGSDELHIRAFLELPLTVVRYEWLSTQLAYHSQIWLVSVAVIRWRTTAQGMVRNHKVLSRPSRSI